LPESKPFEFDLFTMEDSIYESGMAYHFLIKLFPFAEYIADFPVLISAAILLISFVFAGITSFILSRVLVRYTKKTKVQWDDQIVRALRRPIFWTMIFLGLLLAVYPFKFSKSTVDIFQSAAVTLLAVLWTGFALRFIRIVFRAMSRTAREHSLIRPQTRPLFENIAFIIVLIIAVYVIFRSWNIDMTAWLASAGVLGIAIGFAAKDTLANLFSGVFILADAPYKIGDYIVLDSGERGKVTHIGIRSTRMLTREDVEITIPNAIMGNTRIINESGGPYEKYRLRVKVGVAYGSDIDQVRDILMEISDEEPEVCSLPEPRVRFRAFGGSSLDLELLCWVETPEVRGRVLDIINTRIYKRFNEEKIEIPYSKHDLYIKEMPGK